MIQHSAQQVATSGEHLDACQKLHQQIVEAEARLATWKSTVQEQVQQASQCRSDTDAIKRELRNQLTAWQLSSGSFWRRLKWLFVGPGPS
jgi:hypothetical protein